MKYFKLTDPKNKDVVIRATTESREAFLNGSWKATGVMALYMNEESPCYECYEEITEKEALELVGKQSKDDSRKGA